MKYKNIDTSNLQELLEKLASKPSINQAVMTIESGDKSFQWSGFAGQTITNQGKIHQNSPFFIASIDKLYNSTIALLLYEQGRIDLNDSIGMYLPASFIEKIHFLNGINYSDKITIRHLLSHTSGIADWLEDYPKSGKTIVDKILKDGDEFFEIRDICEYVSAELKPHFAPQSFSASKIKVRYSDTNFILLIAIIEAVCGKPLSLIYDEILFSPFSIKNTFFGDNPISESNLNISIPLRAEGKVVDIPKLMSSFRGMYATSADAISFMRKLFQNQIFQNKDTLSLMQANWNRFGFPLDKSALRSPGWPIEYGLGIMRFELPIIFTSFKKLPAVIGHTGSTGCWLFWCPELDLYFSGSVCEATAGAVPYRFVPKVLKLFV